MEAVEQILRCEIAGSWTAAEMTDFLRAIRELYDIHLEVHLLEEHNFKYEQIIKELERYRDADHAYKKRVFSIAIRRCMLGCLAAENMRPPKNEFLYPHEELRVHRIRYASPGVTEFVGLGKVIVEIAKYLGALLSYLKTTQQEKRDPLSDKLDVVNQLLDFNERLIPQMREGGYTDREIR